uniref:Uncharacterized protein n=2 Tax=Anguilla anguilla TaxID=7936 RepID=A0A0E9UIV1_ANGAN
MHMLIVLLSSYGVNFLVPDESWVAVFQKLPRCSSRKSRHRRQLPPHFGCVLSKPVG